MEERGGNGGWGVNIDVWQERGREKFSHHMIKTAYCRDSCYFSSRFLFYLSSFSMMMACQCSTKTCAGPVAGRYLATSLPQYWMWKPPPARTFSSLGFSARRATASMKLISIEIVDRFWPNWKKESSSFSTSAGKVCKETSGDIWTEQKALL